jgi:hypothetical protein
VSDFLKENWHEIITDRVGKSEKGKPKMSIGEVVRLTGISWPTVKKVIDNEPGVSLKLILEVAKAAGAKIWGGDKDELQ